MIGPNLIAKTAAQLYEGTNAVFLALMTGRSDGSDPPEPGMAIHVDDVARVHVDALDRNKIKARNGVENCFLSQGKPSYRRIRFNMF